jgi:hypothetical protein
MLGAPPNPSLKPPTPQPQLIYLSSFNDSHEKYERLANDKDRMNGYSSL